MEMMPIPPESLLGMVGKPIHLRGCHPGCVWILKGIDGFQMLLETPKTKRMMRSHISNACYTRRWEPEKVAAAE